MIKELLVALLKVLFHRAFQILPIRPHVRALELREFISFILRIHVVVHPGRGACIRRSQKQNPRRISSRWVLSGQIGSPPVTRTGFTPAQASGLAPKVGGV
ncbi:hypothetical protein [Pseudoxanthobacter soli]|uniref:hypothetical protein n=1 Tax=Pseudoxanthobacter soli TaxID=433840 RepID=UPI001114E93A|nr:hypothetical protein [Pseudoxanthobacter soli]